MAFGVVGRAGEAGFPQRKVLRLEGLVAVRTYMIVIEPLRAVLTVLLPAGPPTSEKLVVGLEAKPTDTVLQVLPIFDELHDESKIIIMVYLNYIKIMEGPALQVQVFNEKTYDLNVASSLDSLYGAYRAKENIVLVEDQKQLIH